MKSEAWLAALAVWRRLAARRGALAATAAVTLAAGYFAVRVAVAWDVSLPRAATDDLRALPDAAIVAVNATGASAPPCGPATSALPPNARDAATAGGFSVDAMTTSDSLSLTSLPGAAPEATVKAYCAPSVRAHAVLTAGQWPGPGSASATPGAPIPVAVPVGTMAALKLHIGSQITTTSATSHARAVLLVVGAFQRSQNPAGWWAWDLVGPAGVRIVDTYADYDPVVVDPSAFATGALHVDSSTLLLLPPERDDATADLAGLAAQSTTITSALTNDSAPYYALSGELTADLNQLGNSVTTAQSQLLAASLLLGAVTAVGLVAATGLLIGVGAAQSALNRARGAGRWHLLRAHWPELVVLCLAAMAAVPISVLFHLFPTDTGNASPFTTGAAWLGAAATAVLAVAVLCARALRSELPSEVAAARGRQATLAYGLRLGADLVLAALAALALWQASGSPLAGRGPSGQAGVDLVVAAAPALTVVAVAALTGRLVPAAARLAERGASRARRLSTVFALWQVGRTPLGYVLPALVSVAAVAGGTFAVAQNATWQRSAQDQGSYNVGAPVAVTTPWTASAGQAEAVARTPGVLTATPVARLQGTQGGALIAVDSATAAYTVLLRSDLAGQPVTALWHQVGSNTATGIAVPGRPTRLDVSAKLSVLSITNHGLDAVSVTADVQDASGLIFPIDLGSLPADGQTHPLGAAFSTTNPPNYPLRLLRFDFSYVAPTTAAVNAAFSVSVPFASGGQLSGWVPNSTWGANEPCPAVAVPPGDTAKNQPPQTNPTANPDAGGGVTLVFSTGAGLNGTGDGSPCKPISASVSLSADSGKSTINAVATSAYLSSTGTSVGATVPISVGGATLPAHIVASVSAFPTLPATGPGGLVVDLPALAAAVVEQGSMLWPPTEWWLRTTSAGAPAGLPAGASAVTATGAADTLTQDPLTATAPHILSLGAVELVLLAALALAACLAAAGRGQSAHDPVLAALGAGRRQRVAIRVLLNVAIVAPAALLGWGLGLLIAGRLVSVFVLTPSGTAPLPAALLTTRPGWSAAAVAVLLLVGLVAALDLRPGEARRRSRTSRTRTNQTSPSPSRTPDAS